MVKIVTIVSPQSKLLKTEENNSILTWTSTNTGQYAIEILYKRKTDSSWSTTNKITQTAQSYDLKNLQKFIPDLFVEIQYRLLVYYKTSSGDTSYDFSDSALSYSIIFTPTNSKILKIYDGKKINKYPLFNSITKNNSIDIINIMVNATKQQLPLVDTTSPLASKAKVKTNNSIKSLAAETATFTYDASKYPTYGTATITHNNEYAYGYNYYNSSSSSYAYKANYVSSYALSGYSNIPVPQQYYTSAYTYYSYNKSYSYNYNAIKNYYGYTGGYYNVLQYSAYSKTYTYSITSTLYGYTSRYAPNIGYHTIPVFAYKNNYQYVAYNNYATHINYYYKVYSKYSYLSTYYSQGSYTIPAAYMTQGYVSYGANYYTTSGYKYTTAYNSKIYYSSAYKYYYYTNAQYYLYYYNSPVKYNYNYTYSTKYNYNYISKPTYYSKYTYAV